jgi:predicted DNA-binding transcriptional regulator AlpA
MPEENKKRFLRKRQLSERYQTVTRTIDRWVKTGRLPQPIYIGEVPMWDADEIEAVERQAVSTPPSKTLTT